MQLVCSACGAEKPAKDYYANDRKCKECRKTLVRAHRLKHLDYYRTYDRARGNRQGLGYLQKYRTENPQKYAAHTKVNNAVRDGKLVPSLCETCGSVDVVAHHDDYDKPLSVRWLCQAHHVAWHHLNGEGANAH